jgi:hypothetical protein
MFKKYDLEIKKLLSRKSPDTSWKEILETHKIMLSRIQHERLIHLLVMLFVGIIMSLSFFIIIVTGKPDLLLIAILLLCLFFAYLFHYRFLENTTQNWYELEDEIKKNLEK